MVFGELCRHVVRERNIRSVRVVHEETHLATDAQVLAKWNGSPVGTLLWLLEGVERPLGLHLERDIDNVLEQELVDFVDRKVLTSNDADVA